MASSATNTHRISTRVDHHCDTCGSPNCDPSKQHYKVLFNKDVQLNGVFHEQGTTGMFNKNELDGNLSIKAACTVIA